MARTVKVTFTLDADTVARIDRTSHRLGLPKSAVVREAVAEYAARAGLVGEDERRRMLQIFDDVVARIPRGDDQAADAELDAVRRTRRLGGRSTPAE